MSITLLSPLSPAPLVVATHNAGKLAEFSALLQPYVGGVTSCGALGLAEPEETGKTFAENALLKAGAAALASGCVALADDSGLCVNTLGGRPGIYSARWAGPDRDFEAAMRRIWNEMGDGYDRSAYFVSALALAWPDGRSMAFEGRADGTLIRAGRGANGHGYDPWFVPDGFDVAYAEMNPDKKNAISHRGVAVRKLLDWLSGGGDPAAA